MEVTGNKATPQSVRKMIAVLGNKLVYSTANLDCSTGLSRLFQQLVRSNETQLLSVVDHKKQSWSEGITVENLREERYRDPLCTFASCWDFELEYNKDTDDFVVQVTVFDGKNLNGFREGKRLTITAKVPDKVLLHEEVVHWIECELLYYAQEKYEEFLEQKRLDWIKEFLLAVVK